MDKSTSPRQALPTVPAAESGSHPPQLFTIGATSSLVESDLLVLKYGDAFGVFDKNGDISAGEATAEGLYYKDTRHLSALSVTLNGARPILLSSTLRDDNATMTCDLSNPDLYDGEGRLHLDHDRIHVRRSRFLWDAACFERLSVCNFDDRPHRILLGIDFAADFADLFEVRGTRRDRRGEIAPSKFINAGVVLSYLGLDHRRRTTTLRFDPEPRQLGGNEAIYELELAPGERRSLFMEVDCREQATAPRPYRAFFVALRDARRALRSASSQAASIETSNQIFNEAARRNVADLYMLTTNLPEGLYPYAGIPWFSAIFGRDGIITALEMLWLDPSIARGVLQRLAATQAVEEDPASDAEPGKILHEARHGEMAALREVPFGRYYGSIDSTPLFVMLAGAYLERTDDLETVRRLWPHIRAALEWIERYGDRDGDGFVEYARQNENGLVNQGWKDSHDSIFHEDGALAKGPIALVEVQGYVYAAWRAAQVIAHRLDDETQSSKFAAKADAMRRCFDEGFFDEALGTYALALDGDKQRCRVRASNAGHALFSGIAYPERASSVVKTLMSSSGFCGWGVRTIASTEARYNPMSYHNGSVWPHDNALIAAGFARYGFREEAARIFSGLFDASTYVDLRRLPELFCGFQRQQTRGPTFYPVACSPQAWAAAAPLYLIQSCVGLSFEPEAQRIVFTEPVLPRFLDEVVFRQLTVNGRRADVALRRSGRHVVVDVLDKETSVNVVTNN